MQISIGGLAATWADFREFVAAKKRKREPLRWNPKGVVRASSCPKTVQDFERLRGLLRLNRDFGRASERLDALEHALAKQSSIGLPLPSEVIQNEDRSLTLCFGGITVRLYPDGVGTLLGGTAGHFERGITRTTLEALALKSRIQRS
jgi:hypothetical protein